MRSIKQVKFWPGIVSHALWATPKKEDSLLKKTAIYAYDILAAAAVLATVIVGVTIYILGSLFNLCIGHPLKALVAVFYCNPAPFPINMDSPDESSILRKMPLAPKVTSKTLPFVFPRASAPLGIKVTKTEAWPPLNEQYTNNFGEKFFEGTVTIPESDTNFWNFVRQGGTELGFSYLESTHNLVQVAAPIASTSAYQPGAPQLSRELVHRIQTNPEMASKYLLSIFTYLRFFGIELNQHKTLQPTADFAARAANVRAHTHNHFRMSRIVKSLVECGFPVFAKKLLVFLEHYYKEFGLISKNHPDKPSGILFKTQSWLKEREKALPTNTRSWFNDATEHYLESLPSVRTTKQTFASPRWQSETQVFEGTNALITLDSETGRWELPRLKAPPFFCTREEQEKFEASPPATETSAE